MIEIIEVWMTEDALYIHKECIDEEKLGMRD